MAHIALPVGAVERTVGSRVFDVLFLVPFNLLVGDDAVPVTLANHAEDSFTVKHRGMRAGTRLEMMDEAAGGSIVGLAEGARGVGAAVCL